MITHPSKLPAVELPETPLTEYVLRRADELADRIAIVDGLTGRGYTFAELSDRVHELAGGLHERGLGRDRAWP